MLTDQPDEDQARNDWEVLKHRLSEHNVPLNVKKKKQKSFFRYVIFINSIKNNTFMLICLANGIIFVTFATLKPILL